MLFRSTPSLREHLLEQLSLTTLPNRDRSLVAALIEALDETGYLSQPLEEIVGLFPPELGVELEELAIALKHLQNLDPTGVGARSPEECLELQLLAMLEGTPGREHALRIVRGNLGLLAARDFARLRKVLQCDEAALRTAHKLIQTLNPHPGAAFGPLDTRYVIADVILRKVKNVWVASLNPAAMPKLRINRIYADILQANRGAAGSQLAAQLQEARWLIKNVQQRFDTIQRVAQAIVDRQRYFFEHGEVAMRPLVLREIADTIGLHESTVSRVTTQKFMATPRGIFELKYFFNSSINKLDGDEIASESVKERILTLMTRWQVALPSGDEGATVRGLLTEMIADGLARIEGDRLEILPSGRPFLRNACMALDRRLRTRQPGASVFSRTL